MLPKILIRSSQTVSGRVMSRTHSQPRRAYSESSNFRNHNFADLLKGKKLERGDLQRLMHETASAKRDKGDFVPSATVATLKSSFYSMSLDEKYTFFSVMANDLGASKDHITKAAQALVDAKDREAAAFYSAESQLRRVLTPMHEKLFTQINAQPGGMKFLVDLRADLITLARKYKDDMKLKALEDNLRNTLQHWFSVGFLNLQRITWESPALLLEKIGKYSASVHPVSGWEELKLRVGSSKRCFGFFHPSMPLEPLVFIEVALADHILSNMKPIFSKSQVHERDATTAIFYAITSTLEGLSGVDLGQLLIKRVVKELKDEFPSTVTLEDHLRSINKSQLTYVSTPEMTTFSTLSPIPGFKSWLTTEIAFSLKPAPNVAPAGPLLLSSEISTIQKAADILLDPNRPEKRVEALLGEVLDHEQWWQNNNTRELLKPILLRLGARYLVKEKKRGLALDPVANFHVRNGAVVYRLNFLGDTGSKRLSQSYGLMVNYKYEFEHCERNNEAYLIRSEMATSPEVRELLDQSTGPMYTSKL